MRPFRIPFAHHLLVERHPVETAIFGALAARVVGYGDAGLDDIAALPVVHDVDGACCAVEPWSETVLELVMRELGGVQ